MGKPDCRSVAAARAHDRADEPTDRGWGVLLERDSVRQAPGSQLKAEVV